MFCLSCDQESPSMGAECIHCDTYIGMVAEGRGYLPQLETLAEDLKDGEVELPEAEIRLDRLIGCLEALISNLEETCVGLASLELEEDQKATLGGFMSPLREAWDRQLELVKGLDIEGDWSEFLKAYSVAQIDTFRAAEGVNFLSQSIGMMAGEQGVDIEEVELAIAAAGQAPAPEGEG